MSLVLSNVVREIRSFDSVGGNQIRLSEARNLLGQAKADQVIDASERDVLKAVLRAGELTSKAEALLRSALRPSDGHVVSDDRSPLGPQSLTINPAGKLSFDGIQGEDAWEALAEQVAAAHRQGDNALPTRGADADQGSGTPLRNESAWGRRPRGPLSSLHRPLRHEQLTPEELGLYSPLPRGS